MDERVFRRKEKFHNCLDQNLIKKGQESLLRIRKDKLEDLFMKKRISKIEYEISIKSLNLNECQVEHLNKMLENIENVRNPFILNGLFSDDSNTVRISLYMLSNFLNNIKCDDVKNQSFDIFSSDKVVDQLCEICMLDDRPIRYYSSHSLINLTYLFEEVSQRLLSSPENCRKLSYLISKKDFILIEHYIRIIFNMTNDTIYYLKDILNTGVIDHCLFIFKIEQLPSIIIIEVNKLLQKIFENSNSIIKFNELILDFSNLLKQNQNDELSTSILHTLCKLNFHDYEISCIIESGIAKKLVNFCISSNHLLRKTSVSLVSNILFGNDIHTHIMIEFGILDSYNLLLKESDNQILQLTLLGISNLNCGASEINKKVIDKGIFIKILKIMMDFFEKTFNSKDEIEILKECIYCISNSLVESLDIIKFYFLDLKEFDILLMIMFCLEYFLHLNDYQIIYLLLETINAFLDIQEDFYEPKIIIIMKKYNIEKILDILQKIKNSKIQNILNKINEKLENNN